MPLLVEEFMRVEADFDLQGRRLVDVGNIFHYMEPRNLSAAYKFYCNKPLINAHTAEADTVATYEIFKAQLQKYETTEVEDDKGKKIIPIVNDITKLSELSAKTKNADLAGRIIFNDKGIEVFNFGKHKDKPVTEVFTSEPGYYRWMMKGDFPLYTKRIITQIRLKMKA
jgi:DNA polymerase-3 subunit epsilon